MPNPLIAPAQVVYPDFGIYLTYAESVKSATAIRKGIVNVPTAENYKNMVDVYKTYYEPACKHFGKIPVPSFFRCPKLNTVIGGAKNSAHLNGCAIDMDADTMPGVSNKDLFDWIRANLDFDQLILESPDEHGNPAWVHVAKSRDGQPNRHQVLKMVRVNGRSTYQAI